MKKTAIMKVGKMVFWVILLLAIFWMILGITASAIARMGREESNRYFLEQKKIVIKEVQDFLDARGFHNSGVTMGRITHANGETEYRLMIHHGKIAALEEGEREELLEALSAFGFVEEQGEKVEFVIRFT